MPQPPTPTQQSASAGWPVALAGLRILTLILGLMAGAGSAGPAAPGQAENQSTLADAPRGPQRLALPGIENAFRLGPDLYSGGQPEGVAAFEALKRLGVTTLISVDGAPTDVATARRLGLRYVHLPIGYDGLSPARQAALVKAAREAPGPVFVHCHHGKHRGPAAAAVCGLGTGALDPAAARAWLGTAGTDPRYRGLYRDVDRFTPPDVATLARLTAADLPERATVADQVAAMVAVDASFDRLKAIRAAGYRTPAEQPDLDPPHEALMLAEHLRETRRAAVAGADAGAPPEDLLRRLAEAEQAASALEAALRQAGSDRSPATTGRLDAAFDRVGRSCTDCHTAHRDRR